MTNIFNKLTIALSLVPATCFAWGDLGHQAVGEIAERNLTPAAKVMVTHILGAEPLAVAATYPDNVRPDPKYKELDSYHFCEIPAGVGRYEHKHESQVIKRDANAFITQIPQNLIDPKITKHQKMILLRYLAHVVGDVHQPMHVGNGLDQGGNLCQVYWISPATGLKEKSNLHTVWDERIIDVLKEEARIANEKLPIPVKRYFGYPELVRIAEQNVVLTAEEKEKILSASVNDWYKESQDIHPLVYGDSVPNMDPRDRTFCNIKGGKFDPATAPTLGNEYSAKVLPTVQRQIVKGGLRLAKMLNEAALSYKIRTGQKTDSEVIKSILLENKTSTQAVDTKN